VRAEPTFEPDIRSTCGYRDQHEGKLTPLTSVSSLYVAELKRVTGSMLYLITRKAKQRCNSFLIIHFRVSTLFLLGVTGTPDVTLQRTKDTKPKTS